MQRIEKRGVIHQRNLDPEPKCSGANRGGESGPGAMEQGRKDSLALGGVDGVLPPDEQEETQAAGNQPAAQVVKGASPEQRGRRLQGAIVKVKSPCVTCVSTETARHTTL